MKMPGQTLRTAALIVAVLLIGFSTLVLMIINGNAGQPASKSHITTPTSAKVSDIDVAQLYNLTNSDRAAARVAPLKLNPSLNQAAQDRCNDEVARNYYSHTTPDGQPWYLTIQKYTSYNLAAENIAEGVYTTQSVNDAWMASAGHKANILNPDFTDAGFAVCQKGNGLDLVEEFIQEKPKVVYQPSTHFACDTMDDFCYTAP